MTNKPTLKNTIKNTNSLNINYSEARLAKKSRTGSKRSVRFSKFSQLRSFAQAPIERETKSYNKNDYEYFRTIRDYDVLRVSGMVALKLAKGESLTSDEMCLTIGLEHMLSHDVPRRIQAVQEVRALHIKAVLDEQARQGCTGGFSPDLMAYVSMKSSKIGRAGAHQVAVRYFNG